MKKKIPWEKTGRLSMELDYHRLQVVSNFGDGDCGAGAIHARTRISRKREARVAPKFPQNFARVHVYFAFREHCEFTFGEPPNMQFSDDLDWRQRS